jgi:hypothetical protein
MRVDTLFEFIKARHSVYENRKAGKPKPWTDDPILQKYRFCNVFRELDSVTQWVGTNWRTPNAKDPHLWFAMVVARFTNLPDTLYQLGYPVGLDSKGGFDKWLVHFLKIVELRQSMKEQVYNGAYTISTNGVKLVKHRYLAMHVFLPVWAAHEDIENMIQRKGTRLGDLHETLTQFQGLGSFMAAQVIADLKYAQMRKAPDWWTWAASGPGSRRGLNRVCNQNKDTPWREQEWLETLQILHERISGMAAAEEMPQIHAQDLQNCLCEFDKYERVRLGEGRPRSLYPGV